MVTVPTTALAVATAAATIIVNGGSRITAAGTLEAVAVAVLPDTVMLPRVVVPATLDAVALAVLPDTVTLPRVTLPATLEAVAVATLSDTVTLSAATAGRAENGTSENEPTENI